MALVECYECGAHISDRVSACPHCGAPIECVKYEDPTALVECYGCGAHISNRVSACPHCGVPIGCVKYDEKEIEGTDKKNEPSTLQKLLLTNLSYRKKAELLAIVLHWVFVIQLVISIVISIGFVMMSIKTGSDIGFIISVASIPASYLWYLFLELCLGFYAMFVDACKDVRKIAEKK